MFDFLKKSKVFSNADAELLKENGFEDLVDDENFHRFLGLMTEAVTEDPSEVVYTCISVIISLSHYCELSEEDFDGVLEQMKRMYLEVDTEENRLLRESMLKYDLV